MQAGRVTFCPLNRISAESVRYPADLGTDAQPLLGRLKFDGRFQKAVQQARPAHLKLKGCSARITACMCMYSLRTHVVWEDTLPLALTYYCRTLLNLADPVPDGCKRALLLHCLTISLLERHGAGVAIHAQRPCMRCMHGLCNGGERHQYREMAVESMGLSDVASNG